MKYFTFFGMLSSYCYVFTTKDQPIERWKSSNFLAALVGRTRHSFRRLWQGNVTRCSLLHKFIDGHR